MTQRNPKRPSKSRFSVAPQANISRSSFDLSHPYKGTFNSGELIPILCEEVLPGDTFRVNMRALTRLSTPLHPTMDNLHLSSQFFFIPNRLVWDNWQRFMGEQANPGDSTDFIVPVKTTTVGIGDLSDYFGLPTLTNQPISFNVLPQRGYALVWNEWYRDENLQNSTTLDTGDGPDTVTNMQVLRRGKRKDYLSSALPWPYKGPGVDVPLGGMAPIEGIALRRDYTAETAQTTLRETGNSNDITYDFPVSSQDATVADAIFIETNAASGSGNGLPLMYANLDRATGSVTINELREAFQIQKLAERDARGGTRYTELLKSHFQVTSPDSRLQRPEYLGGGQTPVQMNTVPQTSSTDQTSAQGNLTAYATAITTRHGFTKSFVEHGYILGLISVRADLNYQQKIDRHWSRSTKYDFYWPALQALGEQPVYNREIYANGEPEDANVWGYQERWSELRSRLGHITGLFRSNATASLDPWHYALDFGSERPALTDTFIQDIPPVKRTIGDQVAPEFLIDAWFDIKAARPLPIYSVPGYIDHF